jgi:hypothetical protein
MLRKTTPTKTKYKDLFPSNDTKVLKTPPVPPGNENRTCTHTHNSRE